MPKILCGKLECIHNKNWTCTSKMAEPEKDGSWSASFLPCIKRLKEEEP